MTSNNPKANNEKVKPRRAPRQTPSSTYNSQQKVEAVLAVWTERCKAAEVCRQMQINVMTFHQWQQRAMEGMLQALEGRVNLANGEALNPRLRTLLQKQHRAKSAAKVSARLEQIQNRIANQAEPVQKQS